MKKARIYLDTSVIGGCLDEEFQLPSRRLIKGFKQGRAIIVISNLTRFELDKSPPAVRAFLDDIPNVYQEVVQLTTEANELALAYIREGVVKEAQLVDAQHIAVATLHRVDVLVSWNFKHIVNLGKIRGYNSINLRRGLPWLEIRTPQEVILDEKN